MLSCAVSHVTALTESDEDDGDDYEEEDHGVTTLMGYPTHGSTAPNFVDGVQAASLQVQGLQPCSSWPLVFQTR
jgi:hypothetical protein